MFSEVGLGYLRQRFTITEIDWANESPALRPCLQQATSHVQLTPLIPLFITIAIVVFALLAFATACDLRTREVPDWISIAIGSIAVASSLSGWLGLSIGWVLLGGSTGLLFGYGLFRFANFGGGDAKLITAIGLLVGPAGLLIVLFGMAITGGVMSLVAIARGQRDLAYAPAITAGFASYVALVSRL